MKKEKLILSTRNIVRFLNLSDIWDKLIRETAKYTVSYASDLMHDYDSVMCYLKEYKADESKSFIFGIRENGVDHAEYVFLSAKDIGRYTKIYQLDIKPYTAYGYEGYGYVTVELSEINYTYDEIHNNKTCAFAE